MQAQIAGVASTLGALPSQVVQPRRRVPIERQAAAPRRCLQDQPDVPIELEREIERDPVDQLRASARPPGQESSRTDRASAAQTEPGTCAGGPRRGCRAPRRAPSVAPSRPRYVRSPAAQHHPVADELLDLAPAPGKTAEGSPPALRRCARAARARRRETASRRRARRRGCGTAPAMMPMNAPT